MIPHENRSLIYEDLDLDPNVFEKKLRIIHFNDVYNIEEGKVEPVGGASRFYTAIEDLKKEGPALIAFSGDALSPSTLSIFSKGNQMIDALNELNIHAAGIGNHEFDMGLDIFEDLIKKSNFPWLLSNIFDSDTSKPLLNVPTKLIIDLDDVKIGIFALAEKDWAMSLSCIDAEDIIYESYVEVSRKLVKELRDDKCEIVIALTHMRWKNDVNLAKKVPEIDLILGGHDHEYETRNVNGNWVIKSGSDFKELSVIEIDISEKIKLRKIEKIIIDSQVPENNRIKEMVDSYLGNYKFLI